MKFSRESLNSSAQITSNIFDNYYPNGQAVVKNTSYSIDGNFSRTLTSRTAADIQSGDALYRSPKFSQTFFTRTVDSSLNSLITSGAEAVHNSPTMLQVNNLEDSSLVQAEGSETFTKNTLSGGIAFNRLMAETLAGRKAGSDFIDNATRLALQEMSNISNFNPSYVGALQHGNNAYETIGTFVTTGSRTVVLASTVSAEEKTWLLDRGNKLKSYNVVDDSQYLTSGFSFDLPDNLSNLIQTTTYYPSLQAGNTVEQGLVTAASQTAYVCPSIIELLIFLQSKMDFRGKLGVNVPVSSQSVNNTALTTNGSVNDHVFGRAFDITFIASKPPSTNEISIDLVTQGNDVSKYRSALDHFLGILSVVPNNLLPDLIVVHPDLTSELGIVSGNESVDSAIKVRYPKFININFQSDSNHRTNIHLSFSAQRSGQYTGPDGTLGVAGSFLAPVAGGADGALSSVEQSVSPTLGQKFKKNYGTSTSETLTMQDVFDLLRGTIMSDEAAAIFAAIVARESNARPAAFNPRVTYSSSSQNYGGDWSVGMFQCNLLTTAHGKKDYTLPFGPTSPVNKKGWQLGWKNYSVDKVTESSFNSFVYSKYRALRDANPPKTHNEAVTQLFPSIDPIVWIPFNQAYLLYTVISGNSATVPLGSSQKLAMTAESGYIYSAWGDYGGGPTYGFISNVDFRDAIQVYESTGKDRILLKRWVMTMFNGSTAAKSSRSYQYASSWVNGYIYPVDWTSSGWVARSPIPPTEDLYAGSTSGQMPGDNTTSTGSGSSVLTSAMNWAVSQIGCPYAAINPYRVGTPPWPGGTLVGFRDNTYTFPAGTIVYDCSGFVIAVWRKAGIDFVSQYGIYSSQGFNDNRIPNATGDYRPMDIAVYSPGTSGVGHVVLIHSKNSDGTYKTIEATTSTGVSHRTLNLTRLLVVKRPI